MSTQESVLLVGNSVRYLAQSARHAGMSPTAIDAFGDLDTMESCSNHRRALQVSPQGLCDAMISVETADSIPLVYSAGFESSPELLTGLRRRHRHVLGNDPSVLALIANPQRFFALLNELDIRHPQVAYHPPTNLAGWLHKDAASCGGYGVKLAKDPTVAGESLYYQKLVDGPLVSLLFAADGRDISLLGYNRLFPKDSRWGDFRFSSAISGYEPLKLHRESMVTAAQRLTRVLGLRGVNGIDFVLDGDVPLMLELNARPPATLELMESQLLQGGLRCHMDACNGTLPVNDMRKGQPKGLHLMYAVRDLRIPGLEWPSWVTDRPRPGSLANKGVPLCTLHAEADDAASVASLLCERADRMTRLLNNRSEEAA